KMKILFFVILFTLTVDNVRGQAGQQGAPGGGRGQGQGQGQAQSPQTPRVAAPFDITGYWVSIVTEDWRWRMVTPAKGDFASIPTNNAGTKGGPQGEPDKGEES